MLSLLAAAVAVFPQAALPMVQPKIVRVSMFKNGYAVILREIKPPQGQTQFHIPTATPATLGTFWILGTGDVELKSAVATSLDKKGVRDAADLNEIIAANKGRRVNLTYHIPGQNNPTTVSGTLVSTTGNIVVFKTENGTQAFNKNSISMIASTEGELLYTVETNNPERVIRITTNGASTGALYTMSLEQGMSWAPAYAVDISDEKKLKITGKATLINDLVDITDVEARLITGFPNIQFLGQYDPFVSPETMRQFTDSLMRGAGGMPAPSSAMTQNAGRMSESFDRDITFNPMNTGELDGFQAEDLFFYKQPNVTLKRGERGYYVLFSADADYEHIYTVSLPGDSAERILNTAGSQQDVWHELKFKNTAKLPFTTAAATTIKDGEIIGQDMMTYTSPGGEVNLKITKALDIQVSGTAEEVSREEGSIKDRHGNNIYDLVTVKGQIEMRNMKPTDVKMQITKQVEGDVVSTSPEAKTIKLPTGLNQVNSTSVMKWEPTVPKGGKMTLDYRYTVYVRSRS